MSNNSNSVELSRGPLEYVTGKLASGVSAKAGTVVTWSTSADDEFVLAGANASATQPMFVILPRFGAGETADTTIAAGQTVQAVICTTGKVLNVRVAATAKYTRGDALQNMANGQVGDRTGSNAVFGWVTPDGDETAKTGSLSAGRMVPVMCA